MTFAIAEMGLLMQLATANPQLANPDTERQLEKVAALYYNHLPNEPPLYSEEGFQYYTVKFKSLAGDILESFGHSTGLEVVGSIG